MKPFDYAMWSSVAGFAVVLARMFMFDPRRCQYCGARAANAHSATCPRNDRLG